MESFLSEFRGPGSLAQGLRFGRATAPQDIRGS